MNLTHENDKGPAMLKRIFSKFGKDTLFIVILTLGVFFIYRQTLEFNYINFDDPVYVTDNQAVTSGLNFESLSWALGIHEDICMYYQPVAWISHMIDVELWGLDPGKHHLSSVFIHLVNAMLLFFLLKSLGGSFMKSALATALFAFHPVNVDAVSWIAERKTLVSAFFWFLAMGSYLIYVRKPGVLKYMLMAFLFTLGLLTKPVMITFPCALLLLDIWPLERVYLKKPLDLQRMIRLIAEKIPLFFIVGLWFITPFLSHTLIANETTPDIIPHGLRLANALVSYVKYVVKFFLPFDLSILYPYPDAVPLFQSVSALFFLLAFTGLFLYQFKTRPYLIIGWFWFLGVLFPTSGLILGTLWPAMADRWAYIPYIGLAIITSWLAVDLCSERRRTAFIPLVFSVFFLSWFVFTARNQASHWKDSISIFEKALSVIGYHYLPHQNIATELMAMGRYDEAEKHLSIILEHDPDHSVTLYNMGLCQFEKGNYNASWTYLSKAISLDPGQSSAYLVSGWILKQQNRPDEAVDLYENALKHVKKKDGILFDLAKLLAETGRKEAAELRLIELLSDYPLHVNGILLYADLLVSRNAYTRALFYYHKASVLSPGNARALNGMDLCRKRGSIG